MLIKDYLFTAIFYTFYFEFLDILLYLNISVAKLSQFLRHESYLRLLCPNKDSFEGIPFAVSSVSGTVSMILENEETFVSGGT